MRAIRSRTRPPRTSVAARPRGMAGRRRVGERALSPSRALVRGARGARCCRDHTSVRGITWVSALDLTTGYRTPHNFLPWDSGHCTRRPKSPSLCRNSKRSQTGRRGTCSGSCEKHRERPLGRCCKKYFRVALDSFPGCAHPVVLFLAPIPRKRLGGGEPVLVFEHDGRALCPVIMQDPDPGNEALRRPLPGVLVTIRGS